MDVKLLDTVHFLKTETEPIFGVHTPIATIKLLRH